MGHNYVNGTCTRYGKAESDAGIKINETNFPDENFRKYVSDNCDTDKNGSLSDDEIAAVKEINVYTKNKSDMKGIEYFIEKQYNTTAYRCANVALSYVGEEKLKEYA